MLQSRRNHFSGDIGGVCCLGTLSSGLVVRKSFIIDLNFQLVGKSYCISTSSGRLSDDMACLEKE